MSWADEIIAYCPYLFSHSVFIVSFSFFFFNRLCQFTNQIRASIRASERNKKKAVKTPFFLQLNKLHTCKMWLVTTEDLPQNLSWFMFSRLDSLIYNQFCFYFINSAKVFLKFWIFCIWILCCISICRMCLPVEDTWNRASIQFNATEHTKAFLCWKWFFHLLIILIC